jgi:hypothetical protein
MIADPINELRGSSVMEKTSRTAAAAMKVAGTTG